MDVTFFEKPNNVDGIILHSHKNQEVEIRFKIYQSEGVQMVTFYVDSLSANAVGGYYRSLVYNLRLKLDKAYIHSNDELRSNRDKILSNLDSFKDSKSLQIDLVESFYSKTNLNLCIIRRCLVDILTRNIYLSSEKYNMYAVDALNISLVDFNDDKVINKKPYEAVSFQLDGNEYDIFSIRKEVII